eukprot:TRINITY_DN36052_c0_g2_i2.p1 TRINITY_DN36052_c0_g2~~TRINITY_DN36052_c0_g2_i2.p1  ORF type:complete len:410 (-),score=54.35 TRINITY_DN36052_c0_g2_i2:24-1253(-)
MRSSTKVLQSLNRVHLQRLTTHTTAEICVAPANESGYRSPGLFYTAVMQVGEASTSVRYRVGSDSGWSNWFAARSPPAIGMKVRILAFGDLGHRPDDDSLEADSIPWYEQAFARGDPGATNTTSAMLLDHLQDPADMIFHNGDLSYAMGYSAEWEAFHDAIEPLSSEVPWMVTMGNHERDWAGSGSSVGDTDSLGECGVPALRRFPSMPYASHRLPPHDQPWYELRVGPIALVALSTEHDLAPGSPQHDFLAAALDRVDRSVTPWTLLAGHRPYHISSAWEGDEEFAQGFRDAIGSVIEGRVDLVLGAHHHSFQRTCALRQGHCVSTGDDTKQGFVVINLGMGGSVNSQANATQPAIFRYVDDKHFGYCRLEADMNSLSLEYVRSDDGTVRDRLRLEKPASAAAAVAVV